jgi:prepilin-type N-terminal cleavage/methylation domain-containing protein
LIDEAARQERGASPRPTTRAAVVRGFTLLEIGIAIVILSLLIAVAVPAMGALSGARLQEESRVLGGVIRDNYARTALSGKSTRLVIDMEEDAWWIEDAPAVTRVHRQKLEADREGKAALDPVDERIEDIEKDTKDEGERARLELLAPTQWAPAEGDYGKPHKLNDDVRFKKMWVEHLDDPLAAGQVALYFFPGGFTEEAHITLTDDDDGERTITLVVSSLTGEVAIENEEPRIPDLEDDA